MLRRSPTGMFAALVMLSLASPIIAQNHADGYLVSGLSNIHYVSPTATLTSKSIPGINYTIIMDRDNRTALAFDFTRSAILRVDPVTLAVLNTAYTHPTINNIGSVLSMAFDHAGELYYSASTPVGGVFKFTNTTTIATVKTGAPFTNIRGMIVDINTGELLAGDFQNGDLFQLRRDGSVFNTLGGGFTLDYGITQDVLSGDVFAGTSTQTASIEVLRNGQSKAQSFLSHPQLRGGWGPITDRASAATRRLVTAAWADPGTAGSDGVWHVDLSSAAVVKFASITTPGFANGYHVEPAYGRNLQSRRTGPGQWDIEINFRGQGNKAYALALSGTGVAPALGLTDGRRIPLVIDGITIAGLNRFLTPLLGGDLGTLANGSATAKLDLRLFGGALNGTRLWFCVVVLDPRAPLGLSVIADPIALVVE